MQQRLVYFSLVHDIIPSDAVVTEIISASSSARSGHSINLSCAIIRYRAGQLGNSLRDAFRRWIRGIDADWESSSLTPEIGNMGFRSPGLRGAEEALSHSIQIPGLSVETDEQRAVNIS